MSLNPRESINGVTPQDLNKMNNNFMSIWKTLFGGLDFSDANGSLKKKIQTQQMPVQGESNFDVNFPAYIRFFVPSNTKEITSTSFNFICERYRMDSSVTQGGGGAVNVPIQMSLASASTGVASVSSASGSGATTSAVNEWFYYYGDGSRSDGHRPSGIPFLLGSNFKVDNEYYWSDSFGGKKILGVVAKNRYSESGLNATVVDMNYLNHNHYVNISIEPHSHTITLQPHTHSASSLITLPDHTHNLNEGIKISSKDALGVNIKLNGNVITTMDSMSNNIKNNVDVKDFIKIGEWNVLECTTQNLARITIYGIIELVMNY